MTNEEKMLDILAGMQSSMLEMRNDMNARFNVVDAQFEAMDNRMLKLEFKIETNLETKMDALGDGHAAIIEQLTPRSRIDSMEQEISLLKTIVYQLSSEVQKLKAV